MSTLPFVFVSHAGPDKPRVRHIVEALMAANLKVWIDRPAELGLPEERIHEFFRIHAGARWEDELDEAGREAACILVCWSKHATHPDVLEDRLTWLGEAEYARKEKKLVACRIDDVDPRELPGEHASQHMPRVDPDLPAAQLRATLETLVADIKRKITERLEQRRLSAAARDTFAPYLADRVEQEAVAHEAIIAVARDGGVRPIIVAAPENERPDEFFKRVGFLSAELLRDGGRWFEIEVEWPLGCAPRLFADAYRRNLWRALRQYGQLDDQVIVGALEAKGRPSVIVHYMLAREWGSDETGRVQAWVRYWETLLSGAPRLQALPWLQVKMPSAKPGWKECPPGSSGGRVSNRDIWKAIVSLRRRFEGKGEPVTLHAPPILAPIKVGDADRWINRIDPDTGPDRTRLEGEVKELYRGKRQQQYGVNHQEFANALSRLFQSS